MVDRPRVVQLLSALTGYVGILRELPATTLEEFTDDHDEDVAADQVHTILLTRLGDVDRFADQVLDHLDQSDVDG